MEPYNVKIITYPDLTRQVRIYKNLVEYKGKKSDRVKNPFDDRWTYSIDDDIDKHFEHVVEVSLKRTKKKVYDYARSNDWDWFVTFTFDSKKVDRYDYDDCVKKLSQWFNRLKKKNVNLSYVVVPEQHKDGAWHFHGLFSGIDEKQIVWTGKYVVKRKVGSLGRSKFVRTKDKIYRVGSYKLGWMTATRVRQKERATSYITKYLTKDMLNGLYGRKRYWCSRNLLLPSEETFVLDATDRFILGSELSDDAKYQKKVRQCYGDMTQSMDLYELV